MGQESLERGVARIEELIQALEGLADPAARAPAQELLQLVLELHGAGLARLLELIAEAGKGEQLLYSLTQDERVRALLLLHGLHPENLEQRVRRAIDGQRLRVQGIRVELLGIDEDVVRLRWTASGKGSSAATVRRVIEDADCAAALSMRNGTSKSPLRLRSRGEYCLRQPAFVLRPPRRALRAAPWLPQ